MRHALSVLAGIIVMAGFLPYVYAILRKGAKPVRTTWIIWTTLDTITFAGMYSANTLNGQMTGTLIGTWLTVLLALKYGVPGWSMLDKFCLGGAFLGIVLWQIFDNPTLGILTSLSVIFLGSLPTFASVWKDPSRESIFAWLIFLISRVFAILAIPHWTLADAAQPIVFFTVQAIMVLLILRPKHTPH